MSKRLERIEDKLDELATAVVSLARVEERMVTLFRRMDGYDAEQKDIFSRVTSLERSVGTNGQLLRFAERIFWIALSAGVAAYMTGGFA